VVNHVVGVLFIAAGRVVSWFVVSPISFWFIVRRSLVLVGELLIYLWVRHVRRLLARTSATARLAVGVVEYVAAQPMLGDHSTATALTDDGQNRFRLRIPTQSCKEIIRRR